MSNSYGLGRAHSALDPKHWSPADSVRIIEGAAVATGDAPAQEGPPVHHTPLPLDAARSENAMMDPTSAGILEPGVSDGRVRHGGRALAD